MVKYGYKKYMKQDIQKENPFIKIFVIFFFGMLLFFTFLIKSFAPTVDTSIGDYKEQSMISDDDEKKKIVDDRLQMIQNEDQGRNFSEIMPAAIENDKNTSKIDVVIDKPKEINASVSINEDKAQNAVSSPDVVYKVYIGAYTSADQAKVAKDIIQDSGNGLSPIVKCIGSNNYTLQVGSFKNKQSAEAMLFAVQQNHLPGRIVQEN